MKNKLIRSNEVVWEVIGEQAVLVNSRTGERWTLNAVALAFWKLCDGTRTVESVAKVLATTTRQSLAELQHFAQALTGTGLLLADGATENTWSAQPAHFSVGALRATYQGKSLGGPHRRPSPRGNSGPG